MKLLIDSANAEGVKKYNKILNIYGVTTNPQICVNEHKPFAQIFRELDEVLACDQVLCAQPVSTDFENMMAEGRYLANLRKNMIVKIPVTETGLQVIKTLSKEGITVLGTVVMNTVQGFMGAMNGARYLAPYVNKMSDYTDGVQETISLQKIIDMNGLNCDVVGCSLKNTTQIHKLMEGGIRAFTISLDLLGKLYNSPLVDDAVNKFTKSWKEEYGKVKLL